MNRRNQRASLTSKHHVAACVFKGLTVMPEIISNRETAKLSSICFAQACYSGEVSSDDSGSDARAARPIQDRLD